MGIEARQTFFSAGSHSGGLFVRQAISSGSRARDHKVYQKIWLNWERRERKEARNREATRQFLSDQGRRLVWLIRLSLQCGLYKSFKASDIVYRNFNSSQKGISIKTSSHVDLRRYVLRFLPVR